MHGVHIWRTQLLCLVWEVIKQKQYFSTNTISNRTNSLCASICLYLQYCNRVRKALQNATFKIKQKQWANKKQQLNRSQSHYVTDWLTDWLTVQPKNNNRSGRGGKGKKDVPGIAHQSEPSDLLFDIFVTYVMTWHQDSRHFETTHPWTQTLCTSFSDKLPPFRKLPPNSKMRLTDSIVSLKKKNNVNGIKYPSVWRQSRNWRAGQSTPQLWASPTH